jgi:hypothetical protein
MASEQLSMEKMRGFQPLAPEHLSLLSLRSFEDKISGTEARACEAWRTLVDERASAGLKAHEITWETEEAFARLVHKVVSGGVARDTGGRINPTFPPEKVTQQLRLYYDTLPPRSSSSAQRIAYQDRAIPYAVRTQDHFLEVGVVLGIQRCYIAEGLRQPSRATFAVLTALGHAAHAQIEDRYEI